MSKRRFSLDIKDFFICGLFFVLILAWFQNAVFYKNIFSYGDLGRYFYPIREFAASSIKSGHIPLWNPYLQNGTPFLAILQSCIFYPLSLICYLLPSFDKAFNWFIIIHFFLAGVFIYILMRHWNYSRTASSASSLVFIFGGYLSSVINMNTSLSSVIWLPIIFLFFDLSLKRKRLRFAVLTAVFLGIQFLGGEPTIIYCTAWLLFLYAVGFSFLSYRRDRNFKDVAKIFKLFLIAVSLWIFITMIQFLPFVELLFNSTRAEPRDFSAITKWSLSPGELLSFLIPYIFGNIRVPGGYTDIQQQWMPTFYIGIMPLILIFLAVSIRPNRTNRKTLFFEMVLALSLILSLGRHTPLYGFLYKYVFGFGYIRYPIKFIFISSFALSILSGMGVDALFKIEGQRLKDNITKGLLFLNGLLGLMLVIFLRYWSSIYSYIVESKISGKLLAVPHFKALAIVYLSDSAHSCRLFIIFTIAALTLILYLNRKIRPGLFNFLVLAIIFFDLSSVNMEITKVVNTKLFNKEPQSFSEIKKDKRCFRIMRTDQIREINKSVWGRDYARGQYDRKTTFATNVPMVYKFFDSQGYTSITMRNFSQFMGLIHDQEEPFKCKLINLLNIKYVISTEPIEEEYYQVVYKDKVAHLPIKCKDEVYIHFYVNKNNACMDRAFLVKEAMVLQNRKAILALLKHKDFDPAKLVILEEEYVIAGGAKQSEIASSPSAPRNDKDEEVQILSYKPEEVVIEASLNEPKFLVLSDSYYPGWKVFVDGELDKLYKANYFLRAVYLNRGRHQVRFIYDPLSYKVGKFVSLITIALLFLFGIVKRRL